MLFIGVLKELDGVDALIKLYRSIGKEWRDFICTSCLHGSCTAVSPFIYVSQNSEVVSFQKKKKKNMAEADPAESVQSEQSVIEIIGSLHDLITWPTFGKHENSSILKNFVSTSWKSILKLGNMHFQPCISKVAMATDAESWKHLYERNNFRHPVTLAWFSIQIFFKF